MAFTASINGLLERVEAFVAAHLDKNWVSEPRARPPRPPGARRTPALDALHYPGAICDGAALDAGSRRRLSLTIHSAPVSHRVEVWGLGRTGRPCRPRPTRPFLGRPRGRGQHRSALEKAAEPLSQAGLKRVDRRDSAGFSLSLWMGATAPDSCPECLGKK